MNALPDKPFPPIELPTGETIDAPHPEWVHHRTGWKRLRDAYEGGDVYRYAVYDAPAGGLWGRLGAAACFVGWTSNLVPHKRERMGDGVNEDYISRLIRTPVPTFVQEAVDKHQGKIFNQEIRRIGPKAVEDWWKDVNGTGESIDHWMSSSVAPLLAIHGVLDVLIERPPAPSGEAVRTRADEIRLGLDRPLASYILPDNVLWWRLGPDRRYAQVLIREPNDGETTFVYWDAERWRRYDKNGKPIEGERGGADHPYGRVPIVRGFDEPMRPGCRNVAMPRYEAVAELQLAYYNADSELTLSNTMHAHPTVQGAEEWCKQDGEIPIGPGYALPVRVDPATGQTIEWSYLDPPKGAAEFLRQTKLDIRDAADRAASLTKPAGAGESTTGQSGVSKRIDQTEGNELLGEQASVFRRFELQIAALAHLVRTGKEPEPDSIKIEYPVKFDLFSLDELLDAVERFGVVVGAAGSLPETEQLLLERLVRMMLPGLDDAKYKVVEAEIRKYLADANGRMKDGDARQRTLDGLQRTLSLTQFNQPADGPDEQDAALEDDDDV